MLLCGGLLAYAKIPLALAESQAKEDRLAGVFITENYIEPAAPIVGTSVTGDIVIKEPEPRRIYGTIHEDSLQAPVSFPGLEGFGIYNLLLQDEASRISSGHYACDDIFADIHLTVSDNEEHAEASLYVSAGRPCRYYFNPVYPQADGSLYLLPGEGVSTDSFASGTAFSQSLAQSRSKSFNGTDETEGYRFTVKIISADAPGDTELFFMDEDNRVLRSLSGEELDALFENNIPQMELPSGVSYLLLRQDRDGAGGYTHTLFDRGAESLEYMVSADGNYLHPRSLSLIWK